eukprot:SAG31_NODE_41430_length_276_cov_0.587571_1_plen_35_part_10
MKPDHDRTADQYSLYSVEKIAKDCYGKIDERSSWF